MLRLRLRFAEVLSMFKSKLVRQSPDLGFLQGLEAAESGFGGADSDVEEAGNSGLLSF